MIENLPLSTTFGVEVRGLSLGAPLDPATREALMELWRQHGVLLFRGLGTSEAALIEVSKWFGELEIHPVNANLRGDHPEVLDISYHPPESEDDLSQPVYEVEGRAIASWLPWHSDLVYMPTINHGGILRAIEVPPEGGETGFIDQIAAWEALPDRLKQAIEDKYVVYQLNVNMEINRFLPVPARAVKTSSVAEKINKRIAAGDFPPVAHPMVFEQPGTGRKVLNVSPAFAFGIEGMGEDGDALLHEVIAHMVRPEFTYFHQWQKDDLVLFDNWRLAHEAAGVPPQHRRSMQRTTIKGDYAQGRLATTHEGTSLAA